MKAFVAAAGFALLAGCSSGTPFSDVVGNLRVTGHVTGGSVDVQLYDASTGYPVDANEVEVKSDGTPTVHASRRQLGIYSANIANPERIDLLITTRDRRSVFIALRER